MQNSQKGFTLIELMIVVAIIAILAAIAIPQYQNYIIRSQVARVVAETGDLKTVVEDCLNNGKTGTGSSSDTTKCDVSVVTGSSLLTGAAQGSQNLPTGTGMPQLTVAATGSSIVGTLGNSASATIAGGTITWSRDTNGTWTCAADGAKVIAKYAAQGCPVSGGGGTGGGTGGQG